MKNIDKNSVNTHDAKSFESLQSVNKISNAAEFKVITITDTNNHNRNVANVNNIEQRKQAERIEGKEMDCNEDNDERSIFAIDVPTPPRSVKNPGIWRSTHRESDIDDNNCVVSATSMSVYPKLEIVESSLDAKIGSNQNIDDSLTNISISNIVNENFDNSHTEISNVLNKENASDKRQNFDTHKKNDQNTNVPTINGHNNRQRSILRVPKIEMENYERLITKIDRKMTRINHEEAQNYKWQCNECDKVCKTRKQMQSHVGLRHFSYGQRPFNCSKCNKRFLFKSLLNQHQNIHKSRYQCDVCGKNWLTQHLLQLHKRRMHAGERPCQCATCKRKFRQQFDLRNHENTHAKEKN